MIVKIFGRKSFTQTKKASSSVRKVTSDLLRYIENEEKIYGINGNNIDEEIDFISNEECFHTVLDYISNENKTKKTYVSGYLCDPEFAVEQFIDTKMQNLRRVGKSLEDDTGNQLFHIVQSFPDDLDISDDEVHQCGIELCKKIGVHQAVIASHLHPVFDENGEPHGKQKHNHIMINSHIYQDFIDPEHPDKMKYNDCKETYRQLQIWNDEISVEHGFPIIESDKSNTMYSWTASSIDNENRSWLARMQNDIKETMFSSYDWNDFLEKMKAAGYVISEGKYVTYTAPDRIHKARDKRLGSSYTKAYLNDYFALKSNLSAEVQSEIHKNNDTLSSEQLSDLIKKSPELLYVSIPRRHKKTGKPYKFNLKLNEQLEKSTIETYVNDAAIYPLYNSKKEKLGDVQGSTLKTAIYKTYEEQKRFEEEETRRNTASDITAILKKCQNEFEFSNRNYKNSKTNTPYRISIYNENGTKRTLLEQLLILSMVVVNNEVPEFALTEKQRRTIEKQNATLAIIIAKPDWKTQRIIEAINAAREENIKDPEELIAKLSESGKNISKLRSRKKKNFEVMDKMKPLKNALDTVSLLEHKEELSQEERSAYNEAKAVLYHNSLYTDEKLEDFRKRWYWCEGENERLENELKSEGNRYTKLRKIKYQVELAMNKDYCYSRSKDLKKYIIEEKSSLESKISNAKQPPAKKKATGKEFER